MEALKVESNDLWPVVLRMRKYVSTCLMLKGLGSFFFFLFLFYVPYSISSGALESPDLFLSHPEQISISFVHSHHTNNNPPFASYIFLHLLHLLHLLTIQKV